MKFIIAWKKPKSNVWSIQSRIIDTIEEAKDDMEIREMMYPNYTYKIMQVYDVNT